MPKRKLSSKPPYVTLVAFSHSLDYKKDVFVNGGILKYRAKLGHWVMKGISLTETSDLTLLTLKVKGQG